MTSLGSGLFRDSQRLEGVSLFLLSALSALPAGLLHGLEKMDFVSINNLDTLTGIPAGFFQDNAVLRFVYFSENRALATVPGDLFANSPQITLLDLWLTALTAFTDRFFEPLTALEFLELPRDHSVLSADTDMDADIDPQGVTGTVSTVIALDGNPQSTTPWGANLLWEWTQVASCAANAAEVTSGAVTLTGADTAAPSFTAPASATTLYFRATAKPPGRRAASADTPYDFSDTGCATVTVQDAMGQVLAPSISSVSLAAPPGGDNRWDAGDAVEVVLTFDENVTVDTTNGTPSVTVKLGEDETEKTAAYASGSGTAALTFRYTLATGEGPYTEALLEANSLALNGGAIRSSATQANADLAHNGTARILPRSVTPPKDTGPTATFSNVPESHDGERAFEIGLAFSAESSITSYVTVRDSLLDVTRGTVTGARRKTKGSNVGWLLTVRPDGPGDVTLTLPVRECDQANAVCIGGKPLARAATATVEGPPFTASFDGAPSEHDGSAFTVYFRISVEPEELSYVTVRDSLFTVAGGRISQARRLVRGKDKDWALTVAPDGDGAVTLALIPTTDCAGTPSLCDAGGRKLAGPLALTVEGPPTLSVADASVEEAGDVTLAFRVTLSRTLDEAVTVQYATSDGSATAGSDYTAASGTLTFSVGETEKKVAVAVLDDAHDEGNETLTLTLSNPSPSRVKLADAEATGTITNTDLMPAAWTARFGRTVAEQVLDAMDRRMQAARAPGVAVSLAGQPLDWNAGGGEAATHRGLPADLADWLRDAADRNGAAPRERALTARDLVLDSAFALTTEAGPPGSGSGTLSVWGRGAVTHFNGRQPAPPGSAGILPAWGLPPRKQRRPHPGRRGGQRPAGRRLEPRPHAGRADRRPQPRRRRLPLAGRQRPRVFDADRPLSVGPLRADGTPRRVGRGGLRRRLADADARRPGCDAHRP